MSTVDPQYKYLYKVESLRRNKFFIRIHQFCYYRCHSDNSRLKIRCHSSLVYFSIILYDNIKHVNPYSIRYCRSNEKLTPRTFVVRGFFLSCSGGTQGENCCRSTMNSRSSDSMTTMMMTTTMMTMMTTITIIKTA